MLVYFLEVRGGKPRDEEKTAPSRSAFTFTRDDVARIAVNRSGQSVTIEDHDGKWLISQPINGAADQSAVDSLISSLTGARVERDLPAEPDRMKAYGLDEPAVTVEIKLKSGEEHRVRLGEKDYSELSVYAILDDSSSVTLLPSSALTSSDKSLDDLRDRSLLGVSQFDASLYYRKSHF